MITCFGCGAPVREVEGPVHAYMLSAPGCWALYGTVLAEELGDADRTTVRQLTVDAYAVQHPTNPDPRNRRSVLIHLASLHYLLDQNLDAGQAPKRLARLAESLRGSDLPLGNIPTRRGKLTVADVAGAPDADEHARRVRLWATSAWQAWADEHDRVRTWADNIQQGG